MVKTAMPAYNYSKSHGDMPGAYVLNPEEVCNLYKVDSDCILFTRRYTGLSQDAICSRNIFSRCVITMAS
jgi:hypothetical protein